MNLEHSKAGIILKVALIGLLVYITLVLIFAGAYYATSSIRFSDIHDLNGSHPKITFFDSVYFSVVTFLTIGFGDIIPCKTVGRIIFFLQTIFSLLFTSCFSGLLVYYLIKRPQNLMLAHKAYIRFKKNKYLFTIRIGNKGDDVINLKGTLELFYWRENIRKRAYETSIRYPVLEKTWYFDLDLLKPENGILLEKLKDAIFNGKPISLRFTLVGLDSDTGTPVIISKYYHEKDLAFGKNFLDVYHWDENQKSTENWSNFNKIEHLEKNAVEHFKDYGKSNLAVYPEGSLR
jgi:hypothetical protein